MAHRVYANGAPTQMRKTLPGQFGLLSCLCAVPCPDPFRAVILENTDGSVHASIKQLSASSLPEGDVLVSVAYSSLNYKDALAVTNRGKIVRRFPMVPGN